MSKPEKDNASDFLELSAELTKAEKKKINNQIAEERVEQDGVVRKLGNIAERAVSILGGTGNNIPYVSNVDDKRFIELAKEKLSNREGKYMGGLLEDERENYIGGGLVNKILSKYRIKPIKGKRLTVSDGKKELKNLKEDLKDIKKNTPDDSRLDDIDVLEETIDSLEADLVKITDNVADDYSARGMLATGGSLLADDMAGLEELPIEEPTHTMPDGTEMPGETHIEEDNIPEESEADLEPDGEMEADYLDFILDKALSPEEEGILMSKLEQDEELSLLFDRVVDVAQEFAGSGPVEGPGSGVSDSIPARLSDGEFVFTAAAVEVIGADNLMAIMKEAEAQAEGRQELAEGGLPDEETVTLKVEERKEPKVQIAKSTVNNNRGLLDEDEVLKGIKSKLLLDNREGQHIQS